MQWTIDPMHSHVGFAIKHMMIATVHGQFHRFAGTLDLDEAEMGQASATGTIEVASIDTGVSNRDEHLRSEAFFDVARFPTIAFRTTRIEQTGDHAFRVEGDLTIRGVTRGIGLDVEYGGMRTDPDGKTRIGFHASGSLNRKDYGLVWNVALEAGGMMVGDTVQLTIDAEAIRQAAPVPAMAGSR